ncbi:MAG: response regulator transcription factor [Dehalococcoidia bacterium]|nr:response regulator transcription factor [Dehalococcoidia bacterium]
MKAVILGGTEELAETLRVILQVRWRNLVIQRTSDARESIAALRREEPSLFLIACDEDVARCCDAITQVRSFSDVPLIVVGQFDDVVAKVRTLETGADDWIRPSSIPMEFIARVNALLRRVGTGSMSEESKYFNGALSIDFGTQEVRIDGRRATLTPTEFKVLCQLAKHEGTVVTRQDLLGRVWGNEGYADPEFVKKYIHRLRAKLEEDPAEPRYIVNRRGVGYMLSATSATD